MSTFLWAHPLMMHGAKKIAFTPKNLRNLRQAFHLAKKMGKSVGGSEILQRPLPQ